MSSVAQHTDQSTSSSQAGSFIRSRLGSLLAVLPLGVWTIHHLWSNLAAFEGAKSWEASVTHHEHRIAYFATSVMVLVPLAIHAVWGMSRLFTMKPNISRYPFFGNVKFLLQRLSALGLLGFLMAHLYKASIEPRLLEGHAEEFSEIAAYMHHHTITTVTYLLGTLAVSYHLSNGLSTFAMGWGLVSSRSGLKKAELLSYILFAVFLTISWAAVFALYRAGAAFPNPMH